MGATGAAATAFAPEPARAARPLRVLHVITRMMVGGAQ